MSIRHPGLSDNLWQNPGETAGNGIVDDGDGQSEADEFESLTDPSSGASRFSMQLNRLDPANITTLEFLSASGRHYQLLWSDPGAAAQNRFYQLKSIIP